MSLPFLFNTNGLLKASFPFFSYVVLWILYPLQLNVLPVASAYLSSLSNPARECSLLEPELQLGHATQIWSAMTASCIIYSSSHITQTMRSASWTLDSASDIQIRIASYHNALLTLLDLALL